MELSGFIKKSFNRFVQQRTRRREESDAEEALLKKIDQIILKIDSEIPRVQMYQKRILPSFIQAGSVISELIEKVPGPVELNPTPWHVNTFLRAMFLNQDNFTEWLQQFPEIKTAFRKTQAPALVFLIVTEYKEKTLFGAEMKGEILLKDVMQKAVIFENPLIRFPAVDQKNAREDFQHRLLELLFIQALKQIEHHQALQEELHKQQEILEFKLWGGGKKEKDRVEEISVQQYLEIEQVLKDINQELDEIEKGLKSPTDHLNQVIDVFKESNRHVQMETVTLYLNRNGILVHDTPDKKAGKVNIAYCILSGEIKRGLVWGKVAREHIGALD